ncbi:flagellar biosynthesis protein FlhB [Gynuella sunshinyii]|uniref:Flagellar biosynthetic protein FlhB n=1 Tax=Gynuella sunshinyii YC6258 TaxID=1445510 RepID=A0A0C5VEY2_9GAMM|nr:flagellar biosynthesis protein FlhB [Gynuella sunshinyii]AJQ92726.1 flagellar biosynthesis pathway, component FlhB [Gynuella sunshinyii YC6258]
MAEQEFDKSEQPTPFKLQEARKKGQVAKSLELNSWLLLLAGFGIFTTLGWGLVTALGHISRFLFSQAANIRLTESHFLFICQQIIAAVESALWPFFVTLAIVSILATLVQIGFIWSFFPLKPDIQRLNPVQGFKRLFSLRLLYESAKSVIKLLLFGGVLWVVLQQMLPYLAQAFDMQPPQVVTLFQYWGSKLIFSLLAVLLIITLLDLVYTRRDFIKRMRMSKREVKEEHKKREGDPLIRQKRRQMQKSINAQLVSVGNVPKADVVITNPTHLAVALQYDRASMATPVVVAKGSGGQAEKIKQIARQHRITVMENKPLARALFRQVDVSQPITPDLFPRVAQVYIWLYKNQQRIH